MVKSIFKRILIGVGIALILSFLKGGLIANANAQTLTYFTNNGSNLGSCSNCNDYTYDYSMFTNSVGKSGYLSLNALLHSTNGNSSFIPVLSRVRVISNNLHYNCEVNSTGFSHEVYNSGGSYMNATSYSITCPMTIGDGGVSSVYFQFSGSANFSFYSPATFIVSDSSAITQQIEESTNQQIESQKVCKKYDKSTNPNEKKSLNNQGVLVDNDNFNTSNFIKVNSSDTTIKVLSRSTSGAYHCFYDINKSVISCAQNGTLVEGENITIPTNASYFRFPSNRNTSIPTLEICRSGNQSVVDSTDQLNDTLNDNNISSGTSSTIDSLLGNNNTSEETFGPVADLLLLPLTLFRAFYSGFGGTCTNFTLGTLFGHTLTMPCIDLRSILGNAFYNTLDMAICLFMIYNIILLCIDIFDRVTSFEDPFNDLYSPKHTYHGKHESGGAYHG